MTTFELTLDLAQTILDQASSAIIAINSEQTIVYVNEWAAHVFGYSRAEMLGQPLSLLLPYKARDTHHEYVRTFMAEEQVQRPVHQRDDGLTGRRKDGSVFPVEIAISRAEAHGAPIMIAILTDITKRRELERAERHQRMLAETLQNTAEVLASSMSLPVTLGSIRKELKRVCQYDSAVVLLLDGDKLMPVSGKAEPCIYTENPLLHNALMLNSTLTQEHMHPNVVMPGYHSRMQGWVGIPLVTDDVIMGFLSIGHHTHPYTQEDIEAATAFSRQAALAIRTARILEELENSLHNLKTVQESLIRAARLSSIGELAAGVAHQINNPLMTIVADSALLVKKAPPDSLMRESAEAVQRAAKRAGHVVQRLLEFSRTQTKPSELIDINAAVREAVSLVRSQIEPDRGHITLELAPDLPQIWASDEHIQDVFINLLINARDAVRSLPDGEIIVKSHLWASFVTISIADNGVGIPPEDLDRIFDPFFTTKDDGTGLGLSICYDIVKQHDGVFDVVSEEGKGTTFLIHLPIREHGT